MKLKLDKLLKNKMVLYFTFFLALVTIFGYLVKQNYPAILFFTLVLFLTKKFSSNMIVILGISIIATNLLHIFRVFSFKNIENFEGKEPSPEVKKVLNYIATNYFDDEVSEENLLNKDKVKPNINDKEKVESDLKTIESKAMDLSISDLKYLLDLAKFYESFFKLSLDNLKSGEDPKELKEYIIIVNKGINLINKTIESKNLQELNKPKDKTKTPEKPETASDITKEFGSTSCPKGEILESSADPPYCRKTCADGETFDTKKRVCISKKEAMSGLAPATINSKNAGSGNVPNFDDAKMKENAFDNLEKIFGSDKIRSMTNETNNLSERQNEIMSQLKDVGPLMTQAMSLIKNIDMDAINNISNKMSGMIGNLQQLKTNNE